MKIVFQFAFLFCVTSSFQSFSQMAKGGFKLEDDNQLTSSVSKMGKGGFKLADDEDQFATLSLPKVLLSFDAIIDDKKVELTWSSDTENNNNFFTIEKSKDSFVFEEVTSIKAFGNNSNIISYFDVDFTPFEGISYYRLKQTDSKGTILSSRLVSVNNRTINNNLASNNTVNDEHIPTLLGFENKEVLVVLRNEKGVESYSKVIVNQQNNVIEQYDNENKLDNGTYTVVASSDNKLYSQTVVVR
jgi:hypothetical protein